jgi:NADH:ubiquinone oxidoreductase subunit 6 (subunit J)
MPFLADSPSFAATWRAIIPLAIGAAALYLLLPKPRRRPVMLGSLLGLLAIILGAFFLLRKNAAPIPERILFWCFSGIAVVAAGVMVTQRNPGRAAISFALVVMNVCGLFLLQGAPFLMAATIIIYAGAIIVTFLFVLMLAQQRGFSDADDRSREPFLASLSGFVLLGTILLVIHHAYPRIEPVTEFAAKVDAAAEQSSLVQMERLVGDRDAFVAECRRLVREHQNGRWGTKLNSAVTNVEADLGAPRKDLNSLHVSLQELAEVLHLIRKDHEPKALPAANVEALGYRLYSEHLIAIEIAGTLLLVATIGAIAITHRRLEPRA